MEKEKKVLETKTKPNREDKKGFNVTAFILGLISIFFLWEWHVALPSSILAIVFSIAGRYDGGRGLGILGLLFGVLIFTLYAVIYVLYIVGIITLSPLF